MSLKLAIESSSGRPSAASCGARGWRWSTTWLAPIRSHQARLSGLEAVAITIRPARRANWIAIEPTPPAPPRISKLWPASAPSGSSPSRSNSASQAVSPVRGRAAASAALRLAGRWPQIASSTSTRSALQPGRLMSPANQTRSPGTKRTTASPMASTTPAASQPNSLGGAPDPGPGRPERTLVSTGFTAHASTRTSRSWGPGSGSGSSTRAKAPGALQGTPPKAAIAFMVPAGFVRCHRPGLLEQAIGHAQRPLRGWPAGRGRARFPRAACCQAPGRA